MKFFEREWKGRLYRFYAQKEGDKLWLHFKGKTWLWRKKPIHLEPEEAEKEIGENKGEQKGEKAEKKEKGEEKEKGKKESSLSLKKPKVGFIKASLPGKIQKIFVKKTSPVQKGQDLLLLSSMKIEHHFMAEAKGYVENVFCKEGDIVKEGEILIEIKYL